MNKVIKAVFVTAAALAAMSINVVGANAGVVESRTFTDWDQTGGHGIRQTVSWESRIVTVNGHQQAQIKGNGTAYCVSGSGAYVCTNMFGYFRFHTGAGDIDMNFACGTSIGHSPCGLTVAQTTGWFAAWCGNPAINRYMGGDVQANTGNSNTAWVQGRTPDHISSFVC